MWLVWLWFTYIVVHSWNNKLLSFKICSLHERFCLLWWSIHSPLELFLIKAIPRILYRYHMHPQKSSNIIQKLMRKDNILSIGMEVNEDFGWALVLRNMQARYVMACVLAIILGQELLRILNLFYLLSKLFINHAFIIYLLRR